MGRMGRNKHNDGWVRLVPETLREPTKFPAPKKTSDGKLLVHVDFYLKAIGVPLWERGGKKAFAKSNGLEFATDEEFKELFNRY